MTFASAQEGPTVEIRNNSGQTQTIVKGEGGSFGFSRAERKPQTIKYRLKVCNSQFDQTVYFTLGFETDDVFVTEGWWDVAKDKCIEIDVSQRLKKGFGVPYGNLPKTYYYARIYGDKPLFWMGGEADQRLCINETDTFVKKQFNKDSSGNRAALDCSAAGDVMVSFRRLGDPKTTEQYYYLTF
jgi:hypothetical protein